MEGVTTFGHQAAGQPSRGTNNVKSAAFSSVLVLSHRILSLECMMRAQTCQQGPHKASPMILTRDPKQCSEDHDAELEDDFVVLMVVAVVVLVALVV